VAIVDQLEERKLLTRSSVVGDRRVYALAPTALGIRTFKASLKAVQQHEEGLFSSLSRTEQAELLMLLKKFRGASEKDIR
jgi:DNA-binding MarR family transcriptional regulator